jgi:hypothetical protein
MNEIDIINTQGAQVKALEQAIQERNAVIQALASTASPKGRRFTKQMLAQINEQIEGVSWHGNKDGSLVITVKRKG